MITDNYVLLGNMQVLVWLALVFTVGGIIAAIVFGVKRKTKVVGIIVAAVVVCAIGTFVLYQGKERIERQIAIDAAFFDGQGTPLSEIADDFEEYVGNAVNP